MSPVFTNDSWNTLLNETFNHIRELAKTKGSEYSGDSDRLANFRRNAERLGVSKELVWAIYAAKHWDAITQWIQDLQLQKVRERSEPISGRIDDLIVYLLLLKAMHQEQEQKESPQKSEKTFRLVTWTDGFGRRLRMHPGHNPNEIPHKVEGQWTQQGEEQFS